jgi:hypothetical protein
MIKIQNIKRYLGDISVNTEQKDIFANVRYVCSAASLITESLKKKAEVIQMGNGDIYITETKILTYKYNWSDKKGKFVRARDESRFKKAKNTAKNEYLPA